MDSPVSSVRFIHKAIRTDLLQLEDLAWHLDPLDPDAMELWGRRYAFLTSVMKVHANGEEDVFFPQIDERVFKLCGPFVADHRWDEEVSGGLSRVSQALVRRSSADTVQDLHSLRRLISVESAGMSLHMGKEEQYLLPLMEQSMTFEEQSEAVTRAIGHFSPEQLRAVLPWMLNALTEEEQEQFLNMVLADAPPPVVQAMAGWVKEGLPAAEWARLSRRVARLGQSTE